MFLDRTREEIKTLSDLAVRQDYFALKSLPHRNKGACKIVGTHRLAECSEEMERAALAGDDDRIRIALSAEFIAMQRVEEFCASLAVVQI
jgi:hypothetical protein